MRVACRAWQNLRLWPARSPARAATSGRNSETAMKPLSGSRKRAGTGFATLASHECQRDHQHRRLRPRVRTRPRRRRVAHAKAHATPLSKCRLNRAWRAPLAVKGRTPLRCGPSHGNPGREMARNPGRRSPRSARLKMLGWRRTGPAGSEAPAEGWTPLTWTLGRRNRGMDASQGLRTVQTANARSALRGLPLVGSRPIRP